MKPAGASDVEAWVDAARGHRRREDEAWVYAIASLIEWAHTRESARQDPQHRAKRAK